jgi:hypothetical protein
MWKLINEKDGSEVKIGDKVVSFRGEETIVMHKHPPHKPSSSGHITTGLGYHYVSVYGTKWVFSNSDNENIVK